MENLYFLWQEFQPEETKDDEGINKDFWAHAEARKELRGRINPSHSKLTVSRGRFSQTVERLRGCGNRGSEGRL